MKKRKTTMIACIDVDYQKDQAQVACLVFKNWTDAVPHQVYTLVIDEVEAYVPGSFYKRELPCILQILKQVKEPLHTIVVDGYVWLDTKERPGLGAYLFDHLKQKIKVIGVAKNKFKGSDHLGEVWRGASKKPLYVTAAGMPLPQALAAVQQMHGTYRIPTLLKQVDQVCRAWKEDECL